MIKHVIGKYTNNTIHLHEMDPQTGHPTTGAIRFSNVLNYDITDAPFPVKCKGDDAFFLTESTIQSVIALRKAKVATARIKEVLEKAGVDFHVLTVTNTPVQPETQLQKAVFEAVQTALA